MRQSTSDLMKSIRIGVLLLSGALLAGCELPIAESEQVGYRGTGMVDVQYPPRSEDLAANNVVPDPLPPAPPVPVKARDAYQNVQVLGDLSATEFTRLMTAMTQWLGEGGNCNYCHIGENLASDDIYTKVVSRRMLQMTREINAGWTDHVGSTGVTCYTCHRGNNIPAEYWSEDPGPRAAKGMAGWRANQNTPSPSVADASLPFDHFSRYLLGDEEIRVAGGMPLPHGNDATIKGTEGTYGLMMHMSDGLGVNCTFCHNSRAFASWEESRPQRVTAWHGIRMTRTINAEYLQPLTPEYPEHRLGPMGDAFKANCATCHQGVNKPLGGVSMLADYPNLRGGGGSMSSIDEGEAAENVALSADGSESRGTLSGGGE